MQAYIYGAREVTCAIHKMIMSYRAHDLLTRYHDL